MKRFRKIYLEISNVCNLHCSFCPGTKRKKRSLTEEEFIFLLSKLQPWTDFLYFHLMGEPLCHPALEKFLALAGEFGFKIILTTNGTLLRKRQEMLLASPALHKVNISLHAFEANDYSVPFSDYLRDCCEFGKAAEGKVLVSYRLWNNGGKDKLNEMILAPCISIFPVSGFRSAVGCESGRGSIWSTVINLTGRIFLPRIQETMFSVTVFVISWAFCVTAQLSPAVWITRGISRSVISSRKIFRIFWTLPEQRAYMMALQTARHRKNSAASAAMPEDFNEKSRP